MFIPYCFPVFLYNHLSSSFRSLEKSAGTSLFLSWEVLRFWTTLTSTKTASFRSRTAWEFFQRCRRILPPFLFQKLLLFAKGLLPFRTSNINRTSLLWHRQWLVAERHLSWGCWNFLNYLIPSFGLSNWWESGSSALCRWASVGVWDNSERVILQF